MSHAVVVVGPTAVRGPRPVDAELAMIALDGVDDDLVLVDEQVVTVDQVWRDVLGAALAGRCDGVTVVVPSWWASSRVARVEAAARSWSADVVVRQRVDPWLSTVVEVAAELVVVHADGERHAIARVGPSAGVVEAVVACVDGLTAVTVDVPTGLAIVGAELSHALQRNGIAVTTVDDHAVMRAVREQAIDTTPSTRRRIITPRGAVLTAAALSVTTLVAAALMLGVEPPGTSPAEDVTWLVEGRVAVEVPARWTVERVTSGPGSARAEVRSTSDSTAAIHVTQSQVPTGQTLEMTAEALRLALASEPDGVFVEFTAGGRRAERPVVTYREVRADHHVAWVVLLDRGVRIAIGCQGSTDGVGPEQFCERAIRSVHAVL